MDLLYALGRGEVLHSNERRSALSATVSSQQRSQLMSSWIAAEILRLLSPKKYRQISSFQSFVGSLVHGFGVERGGLSVLSDLCLSCSYAHLVRQQVRRAIKEFTATRHLGPKNFIRYSTDNFDTKRGGKNPGCISHTISTVGVYDEGDLRKIGIFHEDEARQVSHTKIHLYR